MICWAADVANTLIIEAVNDEPVRTAGNVGTLFLVEDEPLTSMGLEDLTYSVGGGADGVGARVHTNVRDVHG